MEKGKNLKTALPGRRFSGFWFLTSCFWLLTSGFWLLPADAAVPVKFTYQGNLRQSGALVIGSRSMAFRIYSSSDGAVPLWTGPALSVAVSTGVFRVNLEPAGLDWENGSLWLELEVEGVKLSPREELTASPYAINSLYHSGKRYATAAVAPASPVLGDLWLDSNVNTLKFWDGTIWMTASSGAPAPHAATHSGTGGDPITSLGAYTLTGNVTFNAGTSIGVGAGSAGLAVSTNIIAAGSVTGTLFSGSGAGLTGLVSGNISAGFLPADVVASSIAVGAISASNQIADGIILGQDIANSTITLGKLNQSGCALNEIPKWDGTKWNCAVDVGAGAEVDPLSIHNQEALQAGATFYVSSGTVNYFRIGGAISLPANSIADTALSANVELLNADQAITGAKTFASSATITGQDGSGYSLGLSSGIYAPAGTIVANLFVGDGSGLSGISAAGDNLGSHVATTTLNMAGFQIMNVSSLTVAYGITASSGIFTASGADIYSLLLSSGISALNGTVNAGLFSGSGALLTNLNAANLAYGTVNDARLSANVGLLDADQLISGVKTFSSSMTVTSAGGIWSTALSMASGVVLSSEASAALGAGIRVSTNVCIVGFASATKFFGDGSGLSGISAAGDNLGDHTATKALDMANNQIMNVSSLTVTGSGFSVGTSTLTVNNGLVGVGTTAPGAKLEVTGGQNPGEYVAIWNAGPKLAAWLRNK
ncbi:MAG: hypothetical protein ABIG11_06095 [bacterium]